MSLFLNTTENIRFILSTLEEREREEFAKLKKVKAKMESR